jgi:hypothetical protein
LHPAPGSRGPFGLSRRELRAQLAIVAIVLWAVAIANVATPTRRLRSGQIKGTDFVQFYMLARLASEGRIQDFDDLDVLRQAQLKAVPESTDVWSPPVYGPQVAIALSPLGRLSYEGALLAWIGITAAGYFALVWLAAARAPAVRRDPGVLLLAALAFPPFWQLVQHGQLSVVAIAGVVGAWAALSRGRVWLAGVSLGLLAYKPSLLAPAAAVLLLSGEWRMVAGAAVSGLAQVLSAAFWVGLDGLVRYVDLSLRLPGMLGDLSARPERMHSLRAFWALLSPAPWLVTALYAASAIAVLILGARAWRRQSDPSLRMAVLVLATLLATPYLFVYDLALLAPAWLWLTAAFLRRDLSPAVGRALYVGYWAPLFAPLAQVTRLQVSVACLVWLLVAVSRRPPALAAGSPMASATYRPPRS